MSTGTPPPPLKIRPPPQPKKAQNPHNKTPPTNLPFTSDLLTPMEPSLMENDHKDNIAPKPMGADDKPILLTATKKTATLQPNPKNQKLLNYASLIAHLPIAVSRTLKDPNLTDKYLMDTYAQETPPGTDNKLNHHTTTKKKFTSHPNKNPKTS